MSERGYIYPLIKASVDPKRWSYHKPAVHRRSIKENILKDDLTTNIKQGQQFTEEVSVGPPVVILEVIVEVI